MEARYIVLVPPAEYRWTYVHTYCACYMHTFLMCFVGSVLVHLLLLHPLHQSLTGHTWVILTDIYCHDWWHAFVHYTQQTTLQHSSGQCQKQSNCFSFVLALHLSPPTGCIKLRQVVQTNSHNMCLYKTPTSVWNPHRHTCVHMRCEWKPKWLVFCGVL